MNSMRAARLLTSQLVLAGLILLAAVPAQGDQPGGSGGDPCSGANATCYPSPCDPSPCPADNSTAGPSGNSTSGGNSGNSTSGGPGYIMWPPISLRATSQPSKNCYLFEIEHPNGPKVSINPVLGYVYIDTGCLLMPVKDIVTMHAPKPAVQIYNNIMNRLG